MNTHKIKKLNVVIKDIFIFLHTTLKISNSPYKGLFQKGTTIYDHISEWRAKTRNTRNIVTLNRVPLLKYPLYVGNLEMLHQCYKVGGI